MAFAADLLPSALILFASDNDGPVFWLLGPVAAIAFYSYIFLRYRNTDKRHAYEYKTVTTIVGDVRGSDTKTSRITGVEHRYIRGENSSKPRERLGAATSITEVRTGE